MPEVGEERRRIREEVIKALREYVEAVLARRLELKLAILYGSFARGDWKPGSDVDLLVVAEGLPPDPRDRWDLIATLIKGLPLEPHAFTPAEFEEMVEHGRMTAADALTEGLVLYADPAYLRHVKEFFERVKEETGLRKEGDAWIRDASSIERNT